ncbi:hypothetical protein VTN77DRAFT_4431 [Rasamsonia byssochlamydoides]|uniref:uncharacterized protein n=1 Tax=Rasamsonia byssochlamydoides TaxID=89139 RepID=UPI00374275C2
MLDDATTREKKNSFLLTGKKIKQKSKKKKTPPDPTNSSKGGGSGESGERNALFLRPPVESTPQDPTSPKGGGSREYNRQGAEEKKSIPLTQHLLERGRVNGIKKRKEKKEKKKEYQREKINRTPIHHDGWQLPTKHMPRPQYAFAMQYRNMLYANAPFNKHQGSKCNMRRQYREISQKSPKITRTT